MKKLINSLLMLLVCQGAFAQGDIDALRYSQDEIGSTAKSTSSWWCLRSTRRGSFKCGNKSSWISRV